MAKKRGRPKVAEGKLREVIVTARLSLDEKKLIDAAAKAAKEKPAAWRRKVLLKAASEVKSNT